MFHHQSIVVSHHQSRGTCELRIHDSSPSSSSQDFGDYSESFYSVQTTEGETISQLIAGYIDLIIRPKKPPVNTDVADDDDTAVVMETEVLSNRYKSSWEQEATIVLSFREIPWNKIYMRVYLASDPRL